MSGAGVTIAIVREDLLGNAMDITPTMLNYKIHADGQSLYNTPPCYSIYVAKLVLEWIKNDIGGLEKMQELNEKKAKLLYDFLDSSELFKGTVVKGHRTVGGMRASIYNAMPYEGVVALVDFMKKFEAENK